MPGALVQHMRDVRSQRVLRGRRSRDRLHFLLLRGLVGPLGTIHKRCGLVSLTPTTEKGHLGQLVGKGTSAILPGNTILVDLCHRALAATGGTTMGQVSKKATSFTLDAVGEPLEGVPSRSIKPQRYLRATRCPKARHCP